MDRSEKGDIFFSPILMQFAAHHIGKTYKDFYLDHTVLVQANLACRRDFGMDAVGLISDPYRETSAYGAELICPDESVPHPLRPLVVSLEEIATLPDPDVHVAVRTRDRIDATRALRKALGRDTPIIGWIEGPLAQACDLFGVQGMLIKLASDPGFSGQMLRKMMPTAKAFAMAQIEAGADIIGVGDAICSQISPKMYEAYIKPLHDEIFCFIQARDTMVKLHICGDITHLLPHIAELNPDIADLDWMVDMESAHQILGSEIIRCGNLDPVAIIERLSADAVFDKARRLAVSEQGYPFILSGGCEITPLTPKENLMAMKTAARLPSTG